MQISGCLISFSSLVVLVSRSRQQREAKVQSHLFLLVLIVSGEHLLNFNLECMQQSAAAKKASVYDLS